MQFHRLAIPVRFLRKAGVTAILLILLAPATILAQSGSGNSEPKSSAQATSPAAPPEPSTPPPLPPKKQTQTAEQQLKQQEHQRILGIIPEFNSSNIADAQPLSPKQKLSLAFKSATDPFQFAFAGVDAAISQAENEYGDYGQGVAGYTKRFAAAYADSFDGAILGNAVLPILFREDPRYFRKATGTVRGRMWYSVLSTVRARGDHGGWVPNYGNLLGNLAAGGISNLYYPSEDRGVGLTFQRALTVSAEGAIGALAYEFWPDIQRWHRNRKLRRP